MNRDQLIKLLGDLFFLPEYRVEHYDVTTSKDNNSIEISSFLSQNNEIRTRLKIYKNGEIEAIMYTSLPDHYGIPKIISNVGIPNKRFEIEFLVDRHKNLLFN